VGDGGRRAPEEIKEIEAGRRLAKALDQADAARGDGDRLADVLLALHHALGQAAVPHAFGGAIGLAYAVASPRATGDVDLNVLAAPDHAHQVFDALPPGVAWTEHDLTHVVHDGQVRVHWAAIPLDLFFNTTPFHRHADERVRQVPFGDATIPVLGADELAVIKCHVDRRRDWADFEAMLQAGSVQPHVVEHWLVSLLGADDERLLRFRDLVAEVRR
jgi:hypothetical protein